MKSRGSSLPISSFILPPLSFDSMFIVDAHLDLSYNALRGRAVELPAGEQTPDDEGIPTVGLPDLRAGGVGLVCATVFCMPSLDGKPGYRTPDEASAVAWQQVAWYDRRRDDGSMRFVTDAREFDADSAPANSAQRAILLL